MTLLKRLQSEPVDFASLPAGITENDVLIAMAILNKTPSQLSAIIADEDWPKLATRVLVVGNAICERAYMRPQRSPEVVVNFDQLSAREQENIDYRRNFESKKAAARETNIDRLRSNRDEAKSIVRGFIHNSKRGSAAGRRGAWLAPQPSDVRNSEIKALALKINKDLLNFEIVVERVRIGDVLMGDVPRLAAEFSMLADIFTRIMNHAVNVDPRTPVRDIVTSKFIAEIIDEWRENFLYKYQNAYHFNRDTFKFMSLEQQALFEAAMEVLFDNDREGFKEMADEDSADLNKEMNGVE